MPRTFSSIVNFTTEQFPKRAGKLAVLMTIENICVSGDLNNLLQFPKHHKRHAHDNIEKATHLAFDHAYTLLAALDVQVALKENNKTTLQPVSSFVRSQIKRKTIRSTADDSQYDSSEDESIDRSKSDDNSSTESSEENSIGEDTSDTSSCDGNNQSNFYEMRVFDNIPPSLSDSYFTTVFDWPQFVSF